MKQSISQDSIFHHLIQFLVEANTSTNLTAKADTTELYTRHILDSLPLAKLVESRFSSAKNCLDLGSGAGFPGLVLALTIPSLQVMMLDANGKKTRFIDSAINAFDLKNATAIHDRAENLALSQPGTFDLIVVRAVSTLDILMEYATPLLRIGGTLIALKQASLQEELQDAATVQDILGFKAPELIPYSISDKDRMLVLCQTHKKPKIKLPRRAGLATKKPLKRRVA